MSDLSPEASQSLEDPEVPVEDAIEQHETLPGEDDGDDGGLKDLERTRPTWSSSTRKPGPTTRRRTADHRPADLADVTP